MLVDMLNTQTEAKKLGMKFEIVSIESGIFYLEKEVTQGYRLLCPVCDATLVGEKNSKKLESEKKDLKQNCVLCDNFVVFSHHSYQGQTPVFKKIIIRVFENEKEYNWFVKSRENKKIIARIANNEENSEKLSEQINRVFD